MASIMATITVQGTAAQAQQLANWLRANPVLQAAGAIIVVTVDDQQTF